MRFSISVRPLAKRAQITVTSITKGNLLLLGICCQKQMNFKEVILEGLAKLTNKSFKF
jgi:hypothetical protein